MAIESAEKIAKRKADREVAKQRTQRIQGEQQARERKNYGYAISSYAGMPAGSKPIRRKGPSERAKTGSAKDRAMRAGNTDTKNAKREAAKPRAKQGLGFNRGHSRESADKVARRLLTRAVASQEKGDERSSDKNTKFAAHAVRQAYKKEQSNQDKLKTGRKVGDAPSEANLREHVRDFVTRKREHEAKQKAAKK